MNKTWRQQEVADLWSTPISNIIQNDIDLSEQYHREFSDFHKARRKVKHTDRVVSWHKAVMGQQMYCFTGWRRYWVWQHTEEREHHMEKVWRVFVNNEAGIGFEVARKYTPQEAMEAWHDYCSKMGLAEIL